jgi:ADP-ribosylglycohydrolase
MVDQSLRDRVAGTLFGLALGDALGAVTEFMSVERILRTFRYYGVALILD